MDVKGKESHWKQKALCRQAEVRKLKKQLSRVRESRSGWRRKYYDLKCKGRQLLEEKPLGYQYSVGLIWLCVYVYYHSLCSLRSLAQMVVAVGLVLQLHIRKPAAATVRLWVNKYGYYCYSQPAKVRRQVPWAVIVDESVAVGQERLLVVLGVPLEPLPFDAPLTSRAVQVLFLAVARSWKSTQIAEALKAMGQARKIAYCVSDKGNNIMGAVRQLGWYHVYDCTHLWAWALQQVYKGEEDFEGLILAFAHLRKRWILSRHAPLLPPTPRSKAKFLNCFVQVDWIERMEQRFTSLEPAAQKALGFLTTYAPLIQELRALKHRVEQMALLLKTKGLSAQNLAQCWSIMQGLDQGRPLAFKQLVWAEWQKYQTKLCKGKTLLCCSDIIESLLGRLKLQVEMGGNQALTESVLSMCGYAQPITKQDVQQAMNTVHVGDIEQWKKQNTIPSLQQKRREFFDKNRPKLKTAA